MIEKEVMPRQDPKVRIKNFNEVALGYSREQAVREASRCLQCPKPLCIKGCPVEIDIPKFIKEIRNFNFIQSIKTLKEKNNLPGICGRVCPQESQCEKLCILAKKGQPISIGRLERFAADWEMKNDEVVASEVSRLSLRAKRSNLTRTVIPSEARNLKEIATSSPLLSCFIPPASLCEAKRGGENSKKGGLLAMTAKLKQKIAVIGSGPAGLTCAADLAKLGYAVTIFESLHSPGGVLAYGIPEFRLPKNIVKEEIASIKDLGVEIKTGMVVGKLFSVKELFSQGFTAIFVGVGAGLPQFLGIEGEWLNRVYSANEFLIRANLMKSYLFPEYETPLNVGRNVAVIGGGNVAMDSARVALRMGSKVTVIYRRSEEEMPARKEEYENAREEGIKFYFLVAPVKILGDKNNWVKGMELIKMKLGPPDSSGRPRPIPIKNSRFSLNFDTVVIAIGQRPNPLIPESTAELKIGRIGNIMVNEETGETNIKGLFAGGDITTGAATVISAMGAGKKAARAIDKYCQKR